MFERKTKTPTILRVLHDNAWSPTDRKDSWIGKGGGDWGTKIGKEWLEINYYSSTKT